jgi:SAM-dependent methyltransferase
LNHYGYDINHIGSGFLNADKTIAAAKKQKLSVCEYLEKTENDPRKHGRRDRIINELESVGVFRRLHRVCEIGAGTGRYLEKVIELAHPVDYEVYETDTGWSKYLFDEYNGRHGSKIICQQTDGNTLGYTADETCDLVHSHAVFVYLPFLQSLQYLNECVRVCRKGGYIVFDFCPSEKLTLKDANAWRHGAHRFLVLMPRKLLDEFANQHCLKTIHTFPIIYGDSQVEYIIWQKTENL